MNAWLEHFGRDEPDFGHVTRPMAFRPTDDAGAVGAAADSTLPLLVLRGVRARLGAQSFGAFDGEIARGERIAILGRSGAGKSTLLRLIGGGLRPLRGDVVVRGRAIAALSRAELSRQRAVLPQSHAVAFGFSAELVVSLGRVAREPDPEQADIVTAALHAACALHLRQRRFDTLSGGEQARVQLARVLAQLWDSRDALLLVDEPVSALDPGLQFELLDTLRSFAAARGHALVAVLHDVAQALSGFERLWLVEDGRLIADLGANESALPALQRLYGIGLEGVRGRDGTFGVLLHRAAAQQPAAR